MSTPTNIPETPMGETVPDSFLKSKEKFHLQLQDIFQNIMRLTGPDQFDQLCQWMEYKQYLTIDDFYDSSYKDPEKFDTKGPATEYKVKGKMNHISPNVAQKLKGFVRWMTHEERPYELHDGFLATLTRESYLKFRHLDTQPLPTLPPSHHESQQHMTSFPSELKQPTHSESKIALNNFKKGTKRDASVYPILKNDKYYDTFQRSFLANLKAQGLYDVGDPDYDPESGDIYEQELFQGKQSFVYSVLVASLQTEKGRELVKEFEGDARSIILKLHHYHTKSNVVRVETPEGYVIPLLVYMHPIRIPTDQDLQMYPHVFFTSRDVWDPSVLDHEMTPSLLEDINQHSDDSLLQESMFNEYGDLHHRAIQTLNIFCDLPSLPPEEPTTYAHLHDSNPAEEDWESLRPYFGWQSEQVIKDTYKVTSRFGGTIPRHDYLKKHFKFRNPVFNIPRQNEAVATDTIFSDTPAINDGSTMAQFFVGRDTLVCDAYGIKSQKEFMNTLYDNIRFRGAMTTLITDGGRYEISKKVADLLRKLFIKQHESEPYHQHQNKAEQ